MSKLPKQQDEKIDIENESISKYQSVNDNEQQIRNTFDTNSNVEEILNDLDDVSNAYEAEKSESNKNSILDVEYELVEKNKRLRDYEQNLYSNAHAHPNDEQFDSIYDAYTPDLIDTREEDFVQNIYNSDFSKNSLNDLNSFQQKDNINNSILDIEYEQVKKSQPINDHEQNPTPFEDDYVQKEFYDKAKNAQPINDYDHNPTSFENAFIEKEFYKNEKKSQPRNDYDHNPALFADDYLQKEFNSDSARNAFDELTSFQQDNTRSVYHKEYDSTKRRKRFEQIRDPDSGQVTIVEIEYPDSTFDSYHDEEQISFQQNDNSIVEDEYMKLLQNYATTNDKFKTDSNTKKRLKQKLKNSKNQIRFSSLKSNFLSRKPASSNNDHFIKNLSSQNHKPQILIEKKISYYSLDNFNSTEKGFE